MGIIPLVFICLMSGFNFFAYIYCSFFEQRAERFAFFSYFISLSMSILVFVMSYVIAVNILINISILDYNIFYLLGLRQFYVSFGLQFNQLTSIIFTIISFFYVIFVSVLYRENKHVPKRLIGYSFLTSVTFLFIFFAVLSSNIVQFVFCFSLTMLFSNFLTIYDEENKMNIKSSKNILLSITDAGFIFAIFIIFHFSHALNFNQINEFVTTMEEVHYMDLFGLSFKTVDFVVLVFVGVVLFRVFQFFLDILQNKFNHSKILFLGFFNIITVIILPSIFLIKLSFLLEKSLFSMDILFFASAILAILAIVIALVETSIKKILMLVILANSAFVLFMISHNLYLYGLFYLLSAIFPLLLITITLSKILQVNEYNDNINEVFVPANYSNFLYITFFVAVLSLAIFYPAKEIAFESLLFSGGFFEVVFSLLFSTLSILLPFKLFINIFYFNAYGKSFAKPSKEKQSFVERGLLLVLAFASIFFGVLYKENLIGNNAKLFWNNSIFSVFSLESIDLIMMEKYLFLIASVVGFILSYIFYIKERKLTNNFAHMFPTILSILSKGFYVDYFYNNYIVVLLKKLSLKLNAFDRSFDKISFFVELKINKLPWRKAKSLHYRPYFIFLFVLVIVNFVLFNIGF